MTHVRLDSTTVIPGHSGDTPEGQASWKLATGSAARACYPFPTATLEFAFFLLLLLLLLLLRSTLRTVKHPFFHLTSAPTPTVWRCGEGKLRMLRLRLDSSGTNSRNIQYHKSRYM